MRSGLLVLAVIALIVIIGLGWAVSVNNRLVGRDQTVQESWAQVQNIYQQRADLVPNRAEGAATSAPCSCALTDTTTTAGSRTEWS